MLVTKKIDETANRFSFESKLFLLLSKGDPAAAKVNFAACEGLEPWNFYFKRTSLVKKP
jgi:hypothetical protein